MATNLNGMGFFTKRFKALNHKPITLFFANSRADCRKTNTILGRVAQVEGNFVIDNNYRGTRIQNEFAVIYA